MSDSYDEIVGLNDGHRILFDPKDCMALVESKQPFRLVCRKEMEMMAAADLGPKWEKAAKYPTLFKRSDL